MSLSFSSSFMLDAAVLPGMPPALDWAHGKISRQSVASDRVDGVVLWSVFWELWTYIAISERALRLARRHGISHTEGLAAVLLVLFCWVHHWLGWVFCYACTLSGACCRYYYLGCWAARLFTLGSFTPDLNLNVMRQS